MQLLADIDPDEVSPVRRGAQGRRFAFAKSADAALAPALMDVLDVPFEREGALVDALRKADAEEDAQRAAVAVVRLVKGFDLPVELIEKAMAAKKPASQGDDPDDEPDNDGDEPDDDDVTKAYEAVVKDDFTADQRRRMAASGEAMDDGSYPIPNRDYLQRAIRAVGRGDAPHNKIRAHIAARARALGATSLLPDDWKVSKTAGDELGASTTKEQQMSETAAPAVPILKADGSWDLSGVPDEARGFYESVLKAADTAKAENATLRERVEKAEASADEANAKLREREFVAKADSEFGKIAPAEDLGAVLKEAHEHLQPETVEKLEAILKGANQKVVQGDLYAEMGTKALDAVRKGTPIGAAAAVVDASSGDAWAAIEKAAEGLVEKDADGTLTQEQAIERVLKTSEGRALYSRYMADYYGGVA